MFQRRRRLRREILRAIKTRGALARFCDAILKATESRCVQLLSNPLSPRAKNNIPLPRYSTAHRNRSRKSSFFKIFLLANGSVRILLICRKHNIDSWDSPRYYPVEIWGGASVPRNPVTLKEVTFYINTQSDILRFPTLRNYGIFSIFATMLRRSIVSRTFTNSSYSRRCTVIFSIILHRRTWGITGAM